MLLKGNNSMESFLKLLFLNPGGSSQFSHIKGRLMKKARMEFARSV